MSEALEVSAIPHRPPFLFVDEIVNIDDKSIATKTLANPNAEFFKGHYPDHPVMPGVLVCESIFQAGALLLTHRLGRESAGKGLPLLTRIQNARFKRQVSPGDTLEIEVSLDDELDNAFFLTGRAKVNGAMVVRVEFACTLVTDEGGNS